MSPCLSYQKRKLTESGNRKSSVARLREDLAAEAAGPPAHLTRTERILENGGDSVAPPARPLPKAHISLLPKKPVLANEGRVRRSINEDVTPVSDEDLDGVADETRHGKATAPDSGAEAEVTADESGDTGPEDHRSPSPAPQGASRTVGGHLRGRASGNVPNFGDTAIHHPVTPALMGRVVLYDNRAPDAVPIFAVKQPVAADLKSVLSSLATKFSPVRSKSFVNFKISAHALCRV